MTSANPAHARTSGAGERARVCVRVCVCDRVCMALLGESAAVTVQSTNNCSKKPVKIKKSRSHADVSDANARPII